MSDERVHGESCESVWYEELGTHVKRLMSDKGYKYLSQVANEWSISAKQLRDYVGGRISDPSKISLDNRRRLYELTGISVFKTGGRRIEMSSENIYDDKGTEKPSGGIERPETHLPKEGSQFYSLIREVVGNALEKITNDVRGLSKFNAGLLKAQRYNPSTKERIDGIMEMFDVLSLEIDYFRTASNHDKRMLSKELMRSPDSFSYITQILNIIVSGGGHNAWMLASEPPARLKRLRRSRDEQNGD